MPKADMLHLSSCLRRDGRPPSARPGLRRSERSRNCSALLSVRLQLGPDYPWPPDLLDLLPGFVRFVACIVTPLVVWICPLKKCLQKKENGFHNKDRKPTASHAVWWMSAELHKNVQKNATTLSRCNANTQELKSDCSIGPSPKTNKDWLMIFGFWEPLALRRWILRFKWMADFFG